MQYVRHATLKPTARELRWLAHMDRHGPQSSEFLFALTRDTHRCKDTALRRLQALRAEGLLHLPKQQRQIAKADFHPFVYDLTRLGRDCLTHHQSPEHHARPTGHWWHGFWVASLSSAVEIAANRAGHGYIPAARILAINTVKRGIPTSIGYVVPDQLFAIKGSDGHVAYVLEVDRGTEPIRSNAARKSLQRSATQYREIISGKTHQAHFGITSPLVLRATFTSASRERAFRELIGIDVPKVSTLVLDAPFPRFETCLAAAQQLLRY